MRLAVTGSRHWTDRAGVEAVLTAVHEALGINAVIHGDAAGVDTFADEWAKARKIGTVSIRPEYEKFPKHYAPLERNTRIVDAVDYVIAFRALGKSNGTDDTIRKAQEAGKLLLVVQPGSGAGSAVEGEVEHDDTHAQQDRAGAGKPETVLLLALSEPAIDRLDTARTNEALSANIRAIEAEQPPARRTLTAAGRKHGKRDGALPDPRPAARRDAAVRRMPGRGRRR